MNLTSPTRWRLRWRGLAVCGVVAALSLTEPNDLRSQPAQPPMPSLPRPTDGLPTDDRSPYNATQISLGAIVLTLMGYIRWLHQNQMADKLREIEAGREDRRALSDALDKSGEISVSIRLALERHSSSVQALQGSVDRNTTATQALQGSVDRNTTAAQAQTAIVDRLANKGVRS